MKIASADERPEVLGPAWERTRDALPEYTNHGDVLNEYWPRLTEKRPDIQFTSSATMMRSSPLPAPSASAGTAR